MSAAVFHPADDDDVVIHTLPSYAEDEAPPNPWDADAEAAERELNAPLAPWEEFARPESSPAPEYLPVAETPPVRQRPLRRLPPTLGRVAPLPDVARTRTSGHWVTRYSALTTASDLRHVLQVGINVLVELRQEQRRAAPIGGLERLASARLLKPLWSHPALREDTAGVLAVLEQEITELVEALELVPIVQRGSGWEMLEAARARAISALGAAGGNRCGAAQAGAPARGRAQAGRNPGRAGVESAGDAGSVAVEIVIREPSGQIDHVPAPA